MLSNEPHREKTGFSHMRKQTQISFAVAAKLISAFVFATWIVQYLFYLNLKFQAPSHLLWLYSLVCVGPGQKPRRLVFSQRGSNYSKAKAGCVLTLVHIYHFFVQKNYILYTHIGTISYNILYNKEKKHKVLRNYLFIFL